MAVLMLKSRSNFLGAIMKYQKCSESKAPQRGGSSLRTESIGTFKNELTKQYTVFPNKFFKV